MAKLTAPVSRFLAISCLLLTPSLRATDYYLGAHATSQPGVAVSSISALNELALQPGDRVYFQGGQTFNGNLELGTEDAGSPTDPIVISSYGTGRATITAGSGTAIRIYNASGFSISRLILIGAGAATSQGNGIDIGVYLPGSTKLPYLRFNDMSISGFNNGIDLWAWYTTSTRAWPGFTDVKLTNLEVFSNRSEGIKTRGTWRADGDGTEFSHSDVTIAHCKVWDNRGDPAVNYHTGSGIVVSGVDGGTIEYCVAHDNGGLGPTSGGGPFGIWVWEARRVTIQYNLVFNQKSSSSLDGGAYDLDGGSSHCVVQYNYSYNNEGPAIGIIQFNDASPLVNSIVRYNISENDCRKNTQGVVYVGQFSTPHGINGADIYGNTFFVSTNLKGNKPPLVAVQNHADIANVRFRNNIFIATHNGNLIGGVTNNPGKALFQGNNYWGGAFDLAVFHSVGQETHNGRALGSRADPQLKRGGGGGAITDPLLLPTLDAYVLQSTSPLINAGLDLTNIFGLNPGPHDFYGLPISSNSLEVGASASNSGTVVTPPIEPTTPEPTPPVAESLAGVVIDDQFNGSGSLSGRVPDTASPSGAKWTILTGAAGVANGVVSTSATLRATIDSGVADGIIETSITLGVADAGLVLRSSDSANYLRLALFSSSLQLKKTQAGSTTTLGSKSATFVVGRTYQLRVAFSGSTIAVSVDGRAIGTFTTTFNQAATRHGLLTSNSGLRSWDRFTVTAGSSAEVTTTEPMVFAPVVIDSPAGVLIDDDFNGTGSLANRIPDTASSLGAHWKILTGTAGIAQGSASTNGTLRAVIDAGAADCTIDTAIVLNTTDTGIILRSSDSSNYLRVSLLSSGLHLKKTEAGVTTTISSVGREFVRGETYQLRADLDGQNISLSINGAHVITHASDFNQNATRHGLLTSSSGERQWERFTVSL